MKKWKVFESRTDCSKNLTKRDFYLNLDAKQIDHIHYLGCRRRMEIADCKHVNCLKNQSEHDDHLFIKIIWSDGANLKLNVSVDRQRCIYHVSENPNTVLEAQLNQTRITFIFSGTVVLITTTYW